MDLKIIIKTKEPKIVAHYKEFIKNNAARRDSGLDIPMPNSACINRGEKGVLVPLGVHIFGFRNGAPAPFVLCPRSSMPLKTPLRLANSIGIIDMGYRGELKAVVDHCGSSQGHEENSDVYHYNVGDRLFQVISPTLEPPNSIEIIEDGENYITARNECGFGSTGV